MRICEVQDTQPRQGNLVRLETRSRFGSSARNSKRDEASDNHYRQMPIGGNKRGKCEKSVSQVALAGQCQGKEQLTRPLQGGLEENHQATHVAKVAAAEKKLSPPVSSHKKLECGKLQGSYILGNSVSGWNFITFTNRIPPAYYGVTKESYRNSTRSAPS